MTKRIKEVFSTDQVCHIWANQSQRHARTSGNNVFFNDTRIYSYGNHYLAGEIHASKNGVQYALVNNYVYSKTTAKHLSSIRSALSGKMAYFQVPNPGIPASQENIDCINQRVWDSFGDLVNMRTKNLEIGRFSLAVSCANSFFDSVGFPKLKITDEQLRIAKNLIAESIDDKRACNRENNTPEKLAEKQASKQKRISVSRLIAIKEFRDFKRKSIGLNLRYDLLRVNESKGVVETSRGAEVPLEHALRLLDRVKSGQVKTGDRIGHFTLNGVLYDQEAHESVIKIGCHTILKSEAETVLGNLEPKLKLAE